MLWARMLAYITGIEDQELLLRNEYLAAENRILRGQIKGRLLLSEGERRHWLRSPNGSDGKPWKNWRRSRSRIRCRRTAVWCRERLGGLLKYYEREAA